jgi:hypothetical protein
LPLIGWALSRFRAQNAGLPLIVWAVLEVAVCSFNFLGQRFDREQEISKLVSTPTLAGKDRDVFFQSTKRGCVDDQRKNELNRRFGVSDQQIETYCDCIADNITKQVLTDEIKIIAQTGKQPESLKEKIAQSATMCNHSVLGEMVDRPTAGTANRTDLTSVLTGKDRDDFIRLTKSSCLDAQRNNAINRQTGVTVQQMDAYCDCYTNGGANFMTGEELGNMVRNGKASPIVQDKIDQLVRSCVKTVFKK